MELEQSPYVQTLLRFRLLFNAAAFNEWAKSGLYNVHKSKQHHDGSECYGGEMFLVAAMLPTGLISNHYFLKDWDLFKVPEEDKCVFEYDHHMPLDVIQRLEEFLSSSAV